MSKVWVAKTIGLYLDDPIQFYQITNCLDYEFIGFDVSFCGGTIIISLDRDKLWKILESVYVTENENCIVRFLEARLWEIASDIYLDRLHNMVLNK